MDVTDESDRHSPRELLGEHRRHDRVVDQLHDRRTRRRQADRGLPTRSITGAVCATCSTHPSAPY